MLPIRFISRQRLKTGAVRYCFAAFVLYILLYILLFIPLTASADAHDKLEDELFTDDNLLIVDLMLGKNLLASDLFIYATPEITLVPLQPLLDGLEFPIQVDPVAQKANGWFLRENNRFDLNVEQGLAIVGDSAINIPQHALIRNDGFDLYIELELLSQWFPITLQLNIGRLQLQLESTVALPVELQLAREQARRTNQYAGNEKNLPHNNDYYRMLGAPVIDVNLGAIAERHPDSGSDSIQTDSAYSVQGNMDMLKMQGSFSASRASTNADPVKRLTLYKRPNSSDQTLPGNLGYAALGDIFGVSDALVLNGGSGLGAHFQFGGNRQTTDFGKRAIEGEAAPQWEVELYRNNALIDFIVVGDDGRYRFDDVPVEYGDNVFDIRLFGPQGQERNRRESIRVGDQALPAGKFFAQASHVNLNDSVFNNNTNGNTNSIDIDEQVNAFEFQAGITQWLSANAGYVEHKNFAAQNSDNDYLQGSLNFSLPAATLAMQYARQKHNGYAALLNTQFKLSNTAFSYTHKHFSEFTSDRNPDGRLEHDIELRVTGYTQFFTDKSWSYQFFNNYQSDAHGNYNYRVENRLGTNFFHGRAIFQTNFNNNSNDNQLIDGTANYIRSVGAKTNIRAALGYNIDPEFELLSANSAITWRHSQQASIQLSINADFNGSDNNAVDASYSYEFKHFTLSANGTVREGGNYRFLLNMAFSLAQENDRRWQLDARPQAHHGRLHATVFLDNNANGEFDENDEALPGIRFSGFSNWNSRQTDQQGQIFLPGLRAEQKTRVKLEQNSISDPYWKSSFMQQTFTSHAGGLHEIQIPVVATVEVEGSIVLSNGSKQRPLSGLPVIVVNANGQEISRSVSEFDGFYVIDNLSPGSYQLKLDEAALRKLGLQDTQPIDFIAKPNAGVIYLDTIVLQKTLTTQALDTSNRELKKMPTNSHLIKSAFTTHKGSSRSHSLTKQQSVASELSASNQVQHRGNKRPQDKKQAPYTSNTPNDTQAEISAPSIFDTSQDTSDIASVAAIPPTVSNPQNSPITDPKRSALTPQLLFWLSATGISVGLLAWRK